MTGARFVIVYFALCIIVKVIRSMCSVMEQRKDPQLPIHKVIIN